jgi:thioredoxin reductase (NADPH)
MGLPLFNARCLPPRGLPPASLAGRNTLTGARSQSPRQGGEEILYETEIQRMSGRRKLESVELENRRTGERRIVETPAVFSMIGALPCTGWVSQEIERDDKGFILTGAPVAQSGAWQRLNQAPGPLETSRPGVFAAGDVRSGSVKRCAAAVGEGGMSVANVHRALAAYRTR